MNDMITDEQRKSRKAQRMAIKAASAARKKQKYVVQKGITETNKKRVLIKRIRQHPNDLQARAIYKAKYGASSIAGLS